MLVIAEAPFFNNIDGYLVHLIPRALAFPFAVFNRGAMGTGSAVEQGRLFQMTDSMVITPLALKPARVV